MTKYLIIISAFSLIFKWRSCISAKFITISYIPTYNKYRAQTLQLVIHFFPSPRWLILVVTFDFDMFCFCFFRLLTLFRMKKRFRDVFGVTVILMPRLISAVVVLYLIYYFFAIIGMECFGHLSLENCCKNTTVEQFYANDTGNNYQISMKCPSLIGILGREF